MRTLVGNVQADGVLPPPGGARTFLIEAMCSCQLYSPKRVSTVVASTER